MKLDRQVFRLGICFPFAFPSFPLRDRQWHVERDAGELWLTIRYGGASAVEFPVD
jgi:hypothetical protein